MQDGAFRPELSRNSDASERPGRRWQCNFVPGRISVELSHRLGLILPTTPGRNSGRRSSSRRGRDCRCDAPAARRESFAHLTGDHAAGNDCIREKSSRLTALRPGWSDQLVVRRTFQEAAAAHNDHTRLVHHLPVLRRVGMSDLVGCQQEQGHRRRLLSGRSQSGLVDHRRLDFRLQHRLRAHRRPGRFRREGRRRTRALRAARLVSARARLGVRAVLHRARSSSRCRSSSSGASRWRAATCCRLCPSSRSSSRRSPSASSRAAWSSGRCCPICT